MGSHLRISQTSSLERHSPNSLSSTTSRAETNIPGLAGERDDLFEIAEDSADMLQPFASPCEHYGTLPCIDDFGTREKWTGFVNKTGCEQEFAQGVDLGDFTGDRQCRRLVSCVKMGAEWKNET